MTYSHLHAEDLRGGVTAPTERWGPITLTDIVRYAGASGDFTPVHHDPAEAASLGLDRVFAMGMMTAGLLGNFVGAWLGTERVRRYAMRFRDKTWVGDVVILNGEVATRSGVIVECDLEARASDGRLLVSGRATAEIPRQMQCCGA